MSGATARPTQNERPYGDSDDLKWAARQWAARVGVVLSSIHVRDLKAKWASVSVRGRLTLSTDAVSLPKPLADFVIVHELVHLLAPNHGKLFRSFLSVYLPDWRDRDQALHTKKPKSHKRRCQR
jgi:predicted metal-dependent hydrolase